MSFFVERNIRTERLEITMITVNAMGDTCPIPVVKTKNAIKELNGAGVVETLVDNEIAVQNLTKMANQKGYGVKSEKISDGQYKVTMEIGEEAAAGNTALSANDAAETEKEENCNNINLELDYNIEMSEKQEEKHGGRGILYQRGSICQDVSDDERHAALL